MKRPTNHGDPAFGFLYNTTPVPKVQRKRKITRVRIP